jgi:hypothetical protein
MSHGRRDRRRIFIAGFQRWLAVSAWSVFFLLGLSGLIAEEPGSRQFAAGMVVVSAGLVLRSLIAFSLFLTPEALIVRSWERTTTIPLDDIVAVRTGLVSNAVGVENHVLFVMTRDGAERRYVSISGSQKPRRPRSDLRRAVDEIRHAMGGRGQQLREQGS